MLDKINGELVSILIQKDLLGYFPEMEKNVGKQIRLKKELWNIKHGTLKRDYSFTIIGVQLDQQGTPIYRAFCNGFDDTFGSLFHPNEIIMEIPQEKKFLNPR